MPSSRVGTRLESNTVTTLGLTVGVSGWAGCRFTPKVQRLPKRLRQICFAVITHDVSGAIAGDASALVCGGINVGPKHLSG
jgi:hypothetical protein